MRLFTAAILRRGAVAVCALSSVLTCGEPIAQTYPAKSVRVVHGFASGSAIDVMIRPVAQKLSAELGQSFVVEARPGATGVIANELVARAPPDGYTVLAAPGSSLVSTPHMRKVPFDPLKDYAPIGLTTTFSFFMVAHPAVPARNAAELIAIGKRRTDLTFGSTGTGSAFHLAGELFAQLGKVKLLHVPYRGGGTGAINDLIGGRVDLMFESPAVVAPYVRAGRLKALGCTGPVRNALLPDVPTIAESGLRSYSLRGWHGMLFPAATSRAVVEHMNAALNRALQSADTKALWAKMGMETPNSTPGEFAELLRSDYERYGKLVASLGLRID